ncbi:protein-tyrosine-phosphatase [Antarcticibacterium flavum]|uniref:Protein-tyrosine-phosphatase n=1 Tax=Antarcticibacterium flavum TaxID=2058175 RepID=A0A5B7X5D0_9FLAO|nr:MULTISPECIES: protein-tyrosine-phosphatase [Antarcticibacterium]MCM4159423.1 protein-tyrosine-phosphatase [Antarcticibacterium sp. W02-3]QCY69938.1 protein-tyrosine-phosphatase [Antarcticibacterium flavum]
MTRDSTQLFPEIEREIKELINIPVAEDRKNILQPLIDYIQSKVGSLEPVRLNFICTHNSRRSHLSQVWAQALACYFKVPQVSCYSGGTEATALFSAAAKTLENSGFKIEKLSDSKNPVHSIKYNTNEHPVIGFSKTYDHSFNPQTAFAAIMTCSQADVGCPFIPGAEKRIPVTYEDPKEFDGSPKQEEKYRERSRQIAAELFYVFSQINLK